ncbi:hypothetical protein LC2W_1437 [Lacticaseibacillus paracasei]|uniref:Uncharacterized protein n=2 Tax=Lacticaseibacillus paracasei TaxID=1597 RepID=A0A806LFS2_LACPA|nr:hypothetical protein LC2W_1437 [Lacticaseibacillus paracasei]AHJ33052.1 hypothetical protein AF91_07560 [Lacticaseibacillus paracasei N1115]EEI67204.1 hypothetical protein HMPREF0530_2539 [Lacticaseibacillus paracasei subsp. paracasei ATCC 25302 = DSM 5622 = JCM 8130]EPC33283.1 hypothetical protein Lpp223_1679 [Lacticaseibacillus paracasei subsp. paracasei Lpp223]EPC39356.1 hypothetical protein Lpp225_0259 [Lacticaseibacillus paracasei subsp. paracasei Lpp225]KRK16579.1 hypothetical protein
MIFQPREADCVNNQQTEVVPRKSVLLQQHARGRFFDELARTVPAMRTPSVTLTQR